MRKAIREVGTPVPRTLFPLLGLLAAAIAGCSGENPSGEPEREVSNTRQALPAARTERPEQSKYPRQMNELGFSVALPPGWRSYAQSLDTVSFEAPDGATAALVRGRAVAGDPQQWLAQRYLRTEPWVANWQLVAADKPQPNVARATFRIKHRNGQDLQATAFSVTSGGVTTIMTAIAPAGRFSSDLPMLSELLYSFRFETPGGSQPSSASPPRSQLAYRQWIEPNEQALSMDLPARWQVQGGVIRPDPHGTRFSVNAAAPGNRHLVFLGDTNIPRMFVQPSQAMRELGQWSRPGQAGTAPNVPYQRAEQFAASYVQQRFGAADVTNVQQIPEAAARLDRIWQMIGSRTMHTAATVEFRLADGRVGAVSCITGVTPTGLDAESATWVVSEISGFVSAADDAATGAAALARALRSTRTNPSWLMQELGAQRQAAGEYAAAREASAELQAKTYDERWHQQERVAEQRGNLLSNTTTLVDPETKETFTTQAGSRYYYRMVAAENRLDRPTMLGQETDFNPGYGDFRRMLELQADGSAR